jgi:peptidoglycan/xylan/chitin deacetylase (PgdA/CDA1 family)
MSNNNFTFSAYENMFKKLLDLGYRDITLHDFFSNNYDDSAFILVNRIDVDMRIDRLRRILEIFKNLRLKGTIFFRLHAPNYNLLSIGNIRIVQELLDIGCEIGLHTELEDVSGYCGINSVDLLRKEIELLELAFGVKVYGTASHGDITHYNNLDFWKKHTPRKFGLEYEAYDGSLWNNCRYISDSEWTTWKAYNNGHIMVGDNRTPVEHASCDRPNILHLLTHPENWYEKYIYE